MSKKRSGLRKPHGVVHWQKSERTNLRELIHGKFVLFDLYSAKAGQGDRVKRIANATWRVRELACGSILFANVIFCDILTLRIEKGIELIF